MAFIGIDLGTTNCCVATVSKGQVQIIENELGLRTTPSVVCFNDKGNKLFGKDAKSEQTRNITTTFHGIKRIMGRKDTDKVVQKFRDTVQYRIINHDHKLALAVVHDEFKTPEQISGLLMAHLKQQCEKRLGSTINNVVITVPTNFNDSQRKATIDAGKIAGFVKIQLLNEPTAAAVEHGLTHNIKDGRVILVYDFGGGTFDVSIIKYNKNRFQVLAVDGDGYLGGNDIDNAILKFITKKYNIKIHTDVNQSKRETARLLNVCEKIKIGLTSRPEYIEELFNFDIPDDEITMHRSEFDKIIEPILNKTMECVDNCLQQDKVKNVKIDDILLVGGSSRILKIKSLIQNKFNIKPIENINPDESVAAGAAIYAARFYDQQFPHLELVDVCPYSLGVETDGGKMSVIIPKYSSLPATYTKTYKTVEDNQTTIEVKIYSGNDDYTKNNNYVGSLEVSGIKSGPKGRTLEETFRIDVNGILHVSVKDKGGQNKHLTLNLDTGNLSENEVESYNKELNQEMRLSHEMKQFAELKNDLRDLLNDSDFLNSITYSEENMMTLQMLLQSTIAKS